MLPEDPSLEELAQCWTLSARDQEEVVRCRGDANRRRFAVQLCTLRTYGRFLPEAIAAPVAITNYLAQQLDLPPMLVGAVPGRLATETDHLQRIRTYLGWQLFDDAARARLMQWLTQRTTDDLLPSDLVSRAEDLLYAWQIIVPARSTLEALVTSVTTHVQGEVYVAFATGCAACIGTVAAAKETAGASLAYAKNVCKLVCIAAALAVANNCAGSGARTENTEIPVGSSQGELIMNTALHPRSLVRLYDGANHNGNWQAFPNG
jgi:hypothetical protein